MEIENLNFSRIVKNFNFGWKCYKGAPKGAYKTNFIDESWRDVDLPHDWSIEESFNSKCPLSI